VRYADATRRLRNLILHKRGDIVFLMDHHYDPYGLMPPHSWHLPYLQDNPDQELTNSIQRLMEGKDVLTLSVWIEIWLRALAWRP
jgi:hypothetical protein